MQPPTPIRRRRLFLGLTLNEVAVALGENIANLSNLERGIVNRPRLHRKLLTFLAAQERLARRGKVVAR
jgi:transcriptional regulator with XRE-family HTH domain